LSMIGAWIRTPPIECGEKKKIPGRVDGVKGGQEDPLLHAGQLYPCP
jgi:hypothetical protein